MTFCNLRVANKIAINRDQEDKQGLKSTFAISFFILFILLIPVNCDFVITNCVGGLFV